MTYICVGNLTIIVSDNGLSPDRRQAIIWTNDGILLIGSLGINFSEILIAIITFSFKKMCLKVSSAKRRPFCLDLNVLTVFGLTFTSSFNTLIRKKSQCCLAKNIVFHHGANYYQSASLTFSLAYMRIAKYMMFHKTCRTKVPTLKQFNWLVSVSIVQIMAWWEQAIIKP